MRIIKIFTDSCADMKKIFRDQFDISYFRLNFMKEGIEREADMDWKSISAKDLYDGLRDGDHVYTLPVTEINYYRKMTAYAKHGRDIIYIACPEVLSKSIVKARRVAAKVMKENPGCRIAVIDSLNASVGQSMVAIKAAKLAAEGLDFDTVVEKTKDMRNNIIQYACVETLTYLSRANRLNASAAILGNIVGIKPILTADVNGRQAAYCQVRGREKSMRKVAELVAQNMINPEGQDIHIMHADCLNDAVHMKELLEEYGVHPHSFRIGDFGTVVGIATGPGTVCVFGKGKTVTFEAEA